MTVRLPSRDLEFAKSYAKEHGVSLTALIHRYLTRLRLVEAPNVPEEVAGIAGIVPQNVDAREEHISHGEQKHR